MPAESLDALVGARIQGASLVAETGLLVLTLFGDGSERRLGIGIGPRVAGVGLLPRSPAFGAAPSTHPLLAALRAHLVGHRIRSVIDQDGELFIAAGGEKAIARLVLRPAAKGEARVVDIDGRIVVRWSATKGSPFRPIEPEEGSSLEEAGALLVEGSDRLAAEASRRALVTTLRAHVKRLSRRAEAVRGDLARLDDAPRLQRIGRMLLAQAERIPKGADFALLEDWEEGGVLEVRLDPASPPRTQAPLFFERARKLQRGEEIMRSRLEKTEELLEKARALEARVVEADEVEKSSLEGWLEEARAIGALKREGRGAPSERVGKAKKEEPRLPYSLYRGHRGARILVGRGAKDNDALTLRIAKPHDLFLHARGVAGAHVIVPLPKGSSCPPDLLVDAALLAAHHSDARGESPVEVTYAERRHVRKAKGSPPGQVQVDREKVLLLRVEPERLARLLASREGA